ncbi:MAG: hypothetical protein GY832_44600 [Chloroflexi bacterium]|nr:hypothetical protein [Chloroflexota bacterium]
MNAVTDYGNCAQCSAQLQAHEFNNCARCDSLLGDAVLVTNSARWLEEEAHHAHPVKPEGMPEGDWNEYQTWVVEQEQRRDYVRAGYYARRMEVAGAFSPRCD